jgi:hypothetical protein
MVRRTYPRAMAAIAIVLAVLLVAVLVASRVALRQQGMLVPGGTPRGVAQPAPDSFPCSLAVTMFSFGSNRGQDPTISNTAGFLNLPSGEFRVDPNANVSGLPSMPYNGPSYSPALKRWIPASDRMISPDGRSYVYEKWLPEGATSPREATGTELRVYDVEKQSDRLVWSQQSSITLIRWDSKGILVDNMPFKGGSVSNWRIDPATGHASQESVYSDPRDPITPLPIKLYLQARQYGLAFSDDRLAVYRHGSRDQGTKYSVVVVESGKISTLYDGTVGDQKDFDPSSFHSDAHGLWIGNGAPTPGTPQALEDGSRMWLWNESSGLRDFKVTNKPAPAAGYEYSNVLIAPAGPCVPGVFAGVAPTALPAAPTPSPSPSPPVVDWSTLTSKPLQLDQLAAGAPCPVSSSKDIPVKGRSSKWPNYGFGNGPAYLSGQFNWYSNGGQGALILVDPKYTGPLLVRSKRLDGAGSLTFGGEGLTTVGDGVYGLPQTGSSPYWGTWFGFLTTDAPGCYGIQFDGTNFSGVVVISVKKGPPPPA